ncbi:MAG: hypothetical protein ACFFE2_09345 [Candidatus Thorarchaeota archaeon]
MAELRNETMQLAIRVIAELGLSDQTQTKCLAILDEHRTRELLTEKNANGIIAGAIYIAAILTENRLTQGLLADLLNISVATIRKYYTLLVKELEIKKRD